MDHRGHAAHFLTRVDRLNTQHAELALGLYRDHSLLRVLLKGAPLPEGADRVALALEDGDNGPYIIVNREGRFITCLGEGMQPYDAPIVKRADLDYVAREMGAWRAMTARAKQGTTEVDRYLSKLFVARSNVTREEFDELVAWSPLLYPHFLRAACKGAVRLEELRRRLANVKRFGRRDEPSLKSFCELAWAQLHLWSLMATTPEVLPRAYAAQGTQLRALERTWVSHQMMGLMTWPGLFRGAMVAAWNHELVLPGFEEELADINTFREANHAMLAIYVACRREPRLCAGSLDALERLRAYEDADGVPGICAILAASLLYERDLPDDGTATRLSNQLIEQWMSETQDAELRERLAAMPASDRRATFFGDPRPVTLEADDAADMLHCFGEVCLFAPRDFYVSAASRIYQPWTFEHGLRWVTPQIRGDYIRAHKPAQRVATPGRNDPCSCGSGKKYKRCCEGGETNAT